MATFSGPLPSGGGQLFCALCAGAVKNAAIDAAKASGANTNDAGTHVDIRKLLGAVESRPDLAVTMAMINLPVTQGGQVIGEVPVLAPVCWTHDIALNLVDTSLALAHGGLPGGAADLSQRRGGG